MLSTNDVHFNQDGIIFVVIKSKPEGLNEEDAGFLTCKDSDKGIWNGRHGDIIGVTKEQVDKHNHELSLKHIKALDLGYSITFRYRKDQSGIVEVITPSGHHVGVISKWSGKSRNAGYIFRGTKKFRVILHANNLCRVSLT